MRRDNILNMTTGSPIRLIVLFAIPLLIGNLFQQVYSLTDSIIVGQFLGAHALAAVGATGSVTFLFFSVCNGISSGAGIVTSQFFGADDPEKTKQAIANSAYVMMAAALVMGTAAFLAAPRLLVLMGTPKELLPLSLSYIRMTCVGVPLVAVYNYSAAMLRALGDSKTPLYFLICSCVLNIGLDLLFVTVFRMGVFGAALATVIAQMTSGIGCMLFAIRTNSYFKLTAEDLRVRFDMILRIIRLGLPLALQWSLIAVSSTLLQTFVNSFGPDAMAAYTASNRIEQLVHMPYGSISSAMATYAGQNFGARNLPRVKQGLKHGMLLIAVLSTVMFAAFQLLNRFVIGLFVSEQAVIEIGARGLRVTSYAYFLLGAIYVSRGLLNGVGDAMFAFINGIVEVVFRLSIPIVLVALIPDIGYIAIWWTTCLTWSGSAVFCMLRYYVWNRKTQRRGNLQTA